MRRIACTLVASALLLAAPGGRARADVDAEVGNGDTITGTIDPATETETLRFRVPKDATFSVSVKAKLVRRVGPTLHVVLKDAATAPIGAPAEGTSVAFSRIKALASGLYSVEITSRDATTKGDYTFSVSWRAQTAYSSTLALPSAGESTVTFPADGGGTATVTLRPDHGVTPAIASLANPDASAGTFSGTKLTLPQTGNYVLHVANAGAAGNCKYVIALRPPRATRRKIALTGATIGGSSGARAFSVVVVPGAAATVTAPAVAPGAPGGEISGSSVDLPANALGSPTAIVIATAPTLGGQGTDVGAGPTVSFGPEGIKFGTPPGSVKVRVTIPLDTAYAGTAAALKVYTRDSKGAVSLVDPPYTVDLVAHTMSFYTSHFSSFRAQAAPAAPTPNFVTVADVTDPMDVCDAHDASGGTTKTVYYVAEGAAKTVGALRQAQGSTTLTHETWVGGGTQNADGTTRLQFQFADPVTTVFAVQGGTLLIGTTTQIFRVDATGAVRRIAGTGASGDTGDQGLATQATFSRIRNIIGDLNGGIFVADELAHRIRFVDTQASGNVFAWAGNGAPGVGVDGGDPATTSFVGPTDVAFAPGGGGLYVADGARIRHLNPFAAPKVNATVAGDASGAQGSTGDGGAPAAAKFAAISGISQYIDPQNAAGDALVVADSSDHTVRLVDFTNAKVSLLAGKHGTSGFSGDNGTAPGLLNTPQAVVYIPNSVLVADNGNGKVRLLILAVP